MRQSLETLIVLIFALVAYAFLPNSEIPHIVEERALIAVNPSTVTDVSMKLENWEGQWQSPNGKWFNEGGEAEAAVYGVLNALAQLRNLPRLNDVPEPSGFIEWKDNQSHQILLSVPKFGENVALQIEGNWYLGDGEVMFKIKELQKVSP